MNCGAYSRGGDHMMNPEDCNWNRDLRGDQRGRNGEGYQDSLTKEQLECLEATFIRFMSNEVKENNSNWEEFYQLLNEACQAEKASFKKNAPHEEKKADKKNCDGETFTNGYSGFKINTEATRKQYRSCNSAKPNIFEQNKGVSLEEKMKMSPENKCHEKQTEKKLPNDGCKPSNGNCNSSCSDKSGDIEIKKNLSENSKCYKSTKKKGPHSSRTTRSNKTSQDKNTSDVSNCSESGNQAPPVKNNCNTYLAFSFFKPYVLEFYVNVLELMSYLSIKSKWCFGKTKEILLFLLCILLIVAVAVWKLLWFVICVIFKVTLCMILWVLCKVLNIVYVIHLKYDIFGKIRCYISNGCDLLFYITGINLKSIFTRKKKETSEERDENVMLSLPTTPEEAVEHLMHHAEDKPFKALCVNRQSSNDEIKTNYKKMALLVHPDKCFNSQADEAFKVLDSCFKTLTDPERRSKLMEEEKRRKEWEEFTKRYSGFEDDFETMMNDLINSISCSKCLGKHKRTLVKDRTFYDARYCGDCHTRHSANDGDIWAENNIFGLNWTCYVCMDGEVYELTEWAECQNLRQTIPINCHRVVCRLGNQKPGSGGSKRRNKHSESTESKKARRKRKQKGRKT